jgi:hypothetical protein
MIYSRVVHVIFVFPFFGCNIMEEISKDTMLSIYLLH